MEIGKGAESCLYTIGGCIMYACRLHPTRAEDLCLRLCTLPLRHRGWEYPRVYCEILLDYPGAALVDKLQAESTATSRRSCPGARAGSDSKFEIMSDAYWHPVASLYFPPAAQAREARAAFAARLRKIEAWDGFKAKNAVPIRKDARIGRNHPCRCGSGKKFKQCSARAS